MREFRGDLIPNPSLPSSAAEFLSRRPLDLEIGAGQGLHAVQYCLRNPGRTLLALERTRNKFEALQSRREHHPQLKNLLALRADAVAAVAHWLPDAALEKVFLLYPNPYPKVKQANLRWHRSPFIQCLHRKMKSDGALNLATNLQWYADEAEEWLTREGLFRMRQRTTLGRDHVPRTHFERKYLERGETCFDLVFEKLLQ